MLKEAIKNLLIVKNTNVQVQTPAPSVQSAPVKTPVIPTPAGTGEYNPDSGYTEQFKK